MPKDISSVTSLEELEEILHSSPEDVAEESPEGSEEDTPVEESNSDSEETSETDEPQEAPQPSEEELLSLLSRFTPEQIIRAHPGVAGKVGAIGQKLANDLAAKQLEEERRRRAELEDQAEEDELLRLAETDPEAHARANAERILRKRNQNKAVEVDKAASDRYGAMLQEEMDAIYKTPTLNALAQHLTDEQLASMYWKNGKYRGFADWAEGMIQTVMEFAREETRKELGSARATPAPVESKAPKQTARRSQSNDDYPANLGEDVEVSQGTYRPGDVDKMSPSSYFANRQQILKDIFGDE